jgi:serine/threonine protein kinase
LIVEQLQADVGNPSLWIDSLKAKVMELRMPTFYTGASCKKGGGGDNGGGNMGAPGPSRLCGNQARDSVFDDPIVRDELSHAGYDVAEAWVEMDMVPFDRVSQISIAKHYPYILTVSH